MLTLQTVHDLGINIFSANSRNICSTVQNFSCQLQIFARFWRADRGEAHSEKLSLGFSRGASKVNPLLPATFEQDNERIETVSANRFRFPSKLWKTVKMKKVYWKVTVKFNNHFYIFTFPQIWQRQLAIICGNPAWMIALYVWGFKWTPWRPLSRDVGIRGCQWSCMHRITAQVSAFVNGSLYLIWLSCYQELTKKTAKMDHNSFISV